MTQYPKNLTYSKEHEWIKEGEGCFVVGVTEYATEQMGDIVHVDLPQPGDEFSLGEAFGVIESVKSVSDVFMPVTGRVTEVNELLVDNPGIINEDPYGEGWIVKIEVSEKEEMTKLMNSDDYSRFLAEEH